MTIQDRLPWRRSAAGVVLIGGLVLLLIADCISAFSTLVWDSVTEPSTTADLAVVLSRFSQDQLTQPWRVENSGQYLGP
jgi:cytochrome c-type biogenesis protein CcmH/NrfG